MPCEDCKSTGEELMGLQNDYDTLENEKSGLEARVIELERALKECKSYAQGVIGDIEDAKGSAEEIIGEVDRTL